jgi:hypothetical protein
MVKDMQTSVAGFKLPGIVGADSTVILDAELMKDEKFAITKKIAVAEK